ncbi:TetR/AcrR family transcriptional regulator [uncultured Corynebacterium sp.]|uniref:TetR/AcrR family transcriptional regulator n=1 Tax=uncultured Corynebacterium sp. TaxID=159447 RepID=UPI0025FBDDE4|nr:TetR/AcrR family transcriptional regulator [uncultured Corynebacterium sp.]
MTTEAGAAPRTRADKERNRNHILEVAEEFFGERGVGGSLDAIAKRAGVGPGTLYRHFPSREDLLAALLQARFDELFARRESIRHEQEDSSTALERWIDALGDYVTAFDGLPDPLRTALSEEASPLSISCEHIVAATDEFLTAAQQDGSARPWVRSRDLVLSVLSTAWVRGAALADETTVRDLTALQRSGWQTAAADEHR